MAEVLRTILQISNLTIAGHAPDQGEIYISTKGPRGIGR